MGWGPKLKERYMTEIVNDAGDVVVEGDQVVAGTTNGKNVELVIIQGSKERSEIKDHINAQFLQMGVEGFYTDLAGLRT